MPPVQRVLLFLVTEDWYFWSHRLPMAYAARDAGFRVAVATRCRAHAERIRAAGFDVYPLRWRRGTIDPASAVRDVAEICALYRRLRPDLVHHIALKPVVLGGLAAALAGVPRVVHSLTGLGFTFGSRGRRAAVVRSLVQAVLRVTFRRDGTIVVVQNHDNAQLLFARNLVPPSRLRLIPGSGVDLDHFSQLPEPAGTPTVAYVGRMLYDKGVRTIVDAHSLLRERNIPAKLWLVGKADPENPTAIPEHELRDWSQRPGVEWHGHVEDVREVWRQCHIAVLASPSMEGLPLSLLEAAACGRVLVATDVPGCRDIAVAGENALLVPPDDPYALARALETLVTDPELRARLAARSRARVIEAEMDAISVGRRIVEVYRELLADTADSPG